MNRGLGVALQTGLVLALVAAASGQRGRERGMRDPVLARCDADHDRGRTLEAAECYRTLLRGAVPATAAEAYWMLGDLKSANTHFRDAVRLDPENPDLRVRWGYLYIESHQEAEAAQLFQEARELDEDHVPARLA